VHFAKPGGVQASKQIVLINLEYLEGSITKSEFESKLKNIQA
jgi:hypothetical protein